VSGSVLARSESDFAQRGQAELVRLFVSQDHVAYAGAFKAADPAATYRGAASLVTPRRPTFREALLELPIPRDVLFGSRNAADPDIAWLPEHGIPDRVIPGAGHDIMTDQPAAFAAAVAEIVR
jgi:pimeloyl-ACP methyl ester carboxylesterase